MFSLGKRRLRELVNFEDCCLLCTRATTNSSRERRTTIVYIDNRKKDWCGLGTHKLCSMADTSTFRKFILVLLGKKENIRFDVI